MRIILLALLAALNVSAATYHVATNGTDAAAGGAGDPWLTIQHAANTATAGDTVLIGQGFYFEQVSIDNANGTEANRIVFDGQGVAQVHRMLVKRPYVTIQNMEFIWPESVTGSMPGYLMLMKGGHYAVISNNWINVVGSSSHEGLAWEMGSIPFDAAAASHCLVISNAITGIRGQVALVIGGTSNLITGNAITNILQSDFMRLFGQTNVIRANRFVTNSYDPTIGFHADFMQTFGNNGHGSRGHIIEQNLISDMDGQISQLAQNAVQGTDYMEDWTIRNNIFARTHLGASITIGKTKWYNNIFYKCNYDGGHVLNLGFGTKGTSAGVRIKNNAFVDCGLLERDNTGWYGVNLNYEDHEWDYNYVGKAGNPVREECPSSGFRWCETNGVNGGDPLFVDADNLDFRLQENSPLIGAGVDLSSLFTDDYNGDTRTSWDIGAIAFDGTPGTPDPPPSPPSTPRRIIVQDVTVGTVRRP